MSFVKYDILDLPVKRQWFDLMKSGEKTEEFRRDCPHWRNRICKYQFFARGNCPRDFDFIRIRCGYTPEYIDFQCRGIFWHETGISRQYGDVRLEMPGPLFVIKLGERRRVKQ